MNKKLLKIFSYSIVSITLLSTVTSVAVGCGSFGHHKNTYIPPTPNMVPLTPAAIPSIPLTPPVAIPLTPAEDRLTPLTPADIPSIPLTPPVAIPLTPAEDRLTPLTPADIPSIPLTPPAAIPLTPAEDRLTPLTPATINLSIIQKDLTKEINNLKIVHDLKLSINSTIFNKAQNKKLSVVGNASYINNSNKINFKFNNIKIFYDNKKNHWKAYNINNFIRQNAAKITPASSTDPFARDNLERVLIKITSHLVMHDRKIDNRYVQLDTVSRTIRRSADVSYVSVRGILHTYAAKANGWISGYIWYNNKSHTYAYNCFNHVVIQ